MNPGILLRYRDYLPFTRLMQPLSLGEGSQGERRFHCPVG